MSNETQHEQSFSRVVQFSSSLGLGTAAAFIWSIDQITPTFLMKFSWETLFAFAFGAVVSWYLWSIVFAAKQSGAKTSLRRKMMTWSTLLLLATFASFAHGLKNHPHEKVIEFAVGSATAILFLTIGTLLFCTVAGFLNKEADQHPHGL